MSKYFMTTKRLGFRRWVEDDLELALGLWGDPAVTRLIDARGKLSEEQVRERLEKEIATERHHRVQYWPIFLLENDAHVGCCGLRPHGESESTLEIGFHIRSAYWGKGYAAEAARAVMAYAFGTLGASALFAGHHPENVVSHHVLERLGFRYTHDEFYPATGLQHPSYLLTAEEHSRQASRANE